MKRIAALGALTIVLLLAAGLVYLSSQSHFDGQIAFSEYGGKLCVFKEGIWNKQCFGEGHYPAWSPGGRSIVFSLMTIKEDASWSIDIYTMDSSGSNLSRLTTGFQTDNYPTWSPSGQDIAFSSGCTLNTMNDAGTNRRALLESEICVNFPDWSPDGNRITFAGFNENNDTWGIYVLNLAHSSIVNLTSGFDYASHPSWSPDGSQIAFEAQRNDNLDIYIMNMDGTDLVRLTNDPHQDGGPVWSPDGQLIAFLSGRKGAQWRIEGGSRESYEIYMMKTDGSEQKPISFGPLGALEKLDWTLAR